MGRAARRRPDTRRTPPVFSGLGQAVLEAAALLAVLGLFWLCSVPLSWLDLALITGAAACVLSLLTRQPWWWSCIHSIFAPLCWAALALSIAPGWFFLAFVLLMLVYRGAASGQIPLYLSNQATTVALAELITARPGLRFLDLGAGIGSVLVPLSRMLPEISCTGVENAPASWLIGWLRTRRLPGVQWRMADLWHVSLDSFDVVYAFLSPAPMPELWKKVRREMRPGSLFISNSFVVPGVKAERIVEVDRKIRLYCYRITGCGR